MENSPMRSSMIDPGNITPPPDGTTDLQVSQQYQQPPQGGAYNQQQQQQQQQFGAQRVDPLSQEMALDQSGSGLLPQMPQELATPGGVYAHDAAESSRATSPPSSSAPFEDDDFTHSLLQKAARNLGVDYTPASHTGIRSLSPGGGSSGGVGAAGVGIRAGPGGGGSEAVLDAHSLTDIQHMIDVRTKALGPNHPSVASLHLQMGDKLGLERASRAENHYNAALAAHEAHYGYDSVEIVPCMSKLANFYMMCGKWSQAKEMFRRSMLVADKKCGGQEGQNNKQQDSSLTGSAVRVDPAKRAADEMQQNSLHQVLRDLAAKRGGEGATGVSSNVDARKAVSGQLLTAWSTSIKDASNKIESEKQRKTIEIQTDVDENDVYLEALPPPSCLSVEQLQRVRAPTLRSARELKDLVGYIKDGNHTPAPLSSTILSSGGIGATPVTAAGRQAAAQQAAGGPMFSPRSEAATRRAQDLQRTIDALREGPQLNHSRNRSHEGGYSSVSRQGRHGGGDQQFSPMDATEREVARLLMTTMGE